jgi:hypothetical protein
MMMDTLRTVQEKANAPAPVSEEERARAFEQKVFGSVAADADEYGQPISRQEMLHAVAALAVDNQQVVTNALAQTQETALRSQMGIDEATEQRALTDRPYIAGLGGQERLQAIADWRAAQGLAPQGAHGVNGGATPPPGHTFQFDQSGQMVAVPVGGGTPHTMGTTVVPGAFSQSPMVPSVERAQTFVERGSPMFEQNAPAVSPAMRNVMAKRQAGQHVTTEELAAALHERGVDVGRFAAPM